MVKFNAPGHIAQDESVHPTIFHASTYGSSGLRLSDDDLVDDFGVLSLSKDSPGPSSSSTHPPSQASSLPIYAPLLTPDRTSPYQPINLNIPSGTSFTSLQRFSSPTDRGLSAGISPSQSALSLHGSFLVKASSTFLRRGMTPQQTPARRPRADLGFRHRSCRRWGGLSSRNRGRIMRQHTSDAPRPDLNDLGKGVPLSSVPASWPFYIVESKAGRTDLFYLMASHSTSGWVTWSLWRQIGGRIWARL